MGVSEQDKQQPTSPRRRTMGARNDLRVVGRWWTQVRGAGVWLWLLRQHRRRFFVLMGESMAGDKFFSPHLGFSRGDYTASRTLRIAHMCGLLNAGEGMRR